MIDTDKQLHDVEKQKVIMRNIYLYVFGTASSLLGSEIFSFAMSLYILKLTGSGLAFSVSLLIKILPRTIISPFAGVFIDRVDRKQIIVLSDFLSGLVMILLLLVLKTANFDLYSIYVSIFSLSCLNTFFKIAIRASKPNIVDKDNLIKINSLGHTVGSISQVAGPFLGGVLYYTGDLNLFILINGISFIISGISEMFINFNIGNVNNMRDKKLKKTESTEKKSILIEFVEGFDFLKSFKPIFVLTIFGVFLDLIMICGVMVAIPVIANKQLHISPTEFGIVQMSFPLGILISSVLMSRKKRMINLSTKIKNNMYVIAIGVFLVGVVTSPLITFENTYIYTMFLSLYGIVSSYCTISMDVPMQLIFQENIPDNIRGRVMGIQGSLSMSVTPIGIIIAGFLTDNVSIFLLPLISGILLLFITYKLGNNKEFSKL